MGAYALHITLTHSLPIPHVLAAFNLVLPFITGLSFQTLTLRSSKLSNPKASTSTNQRPLYNITVLALFIYDTVIATLIGTYIAPIGSLRCGLDDKWQELWHTRDGKSIKRIQDAFECCGLHSAVDRAYPFPGKGVGVDACKNTFGLVVACFERWREEERGIAGLMMGVVLGVSIWQILVVLVPTGSGSWVAGVERDEENQTNGQREVGYPPRGSGRYFDNPEETEESVDNREGAIQPSFQRDAQQEWASERP